MTVRRGRLEIRYAVLYSMIREPKRKTPIMYASNTSQRLLNPLLVELIKKGLIRHETPYYSLTNKGHNYIECIKGAKALLV